MVLLLDDAFTLLLSLYAPGAPASAPKSITVLPRNVLMCLLTATGLHETQSLSEALLVDGMSHTVYGDPRCEIKSLLDMQLASTKEGRGVLKVISICMHISVLPILWAPVGAVLQHAWQPTVCHVAIEVLPHLREEIMVRVANQEHCRHL